MKWFDEWLTDKQELPEERVVGQVNAHHTHPNHDDWQDGAFRAEQFRVQLVVHDENVPQKMTSLSNMTSLAFKNFFEKFAKL